MKPAALRLQLGLFLLLSLALLWGLTLYQLQMHRRDAIRTAEVETRGVARAYAENARATIMRIDLILIELGRTWVVRRGDFAAEIERHRHNIADVGFQVAVADKDGWIRYSSLDPRPQPQPLNLADREHFSVHAGAGAAERLFISKPVLGRLSGKWSLQFTRPLLRDGVFDGVIIVSADPELFSHFAPALPLTEHGITLMLRDSGEVMARAPRGAGYLGRALHGVPSNAAGAAAQGNFQRISELDGTDRLYGYQRLAEHQLSFISALPLAEVLAPLRLQRRLTLAISAAVSLLLGVMAALILRNLAARGRAEAAVRALNGELSMAASVFHNSMDGIMITDAGGTIVSVNPAFTAITAYSAAEALGRKPDLLRSGRHTQEFYSALWRSLLGEGRWQGEIWNRRKNGELFLEWMRIGVVAGADGAAQRYVNVFNDITEVRRKDEHIRHLAFHDPLTGLPNRALLLDRLEQSLLAAVRSGARPALMFIDLDRFKHINDSLGHDAGDHLLKEVARRLRDCLRDSDTLARMGGDEFVLLLEHAPEAKDCAALAHKLLECLALPMPLNGHTLQMGASIGIACAPDDGAGVVALMKHADAAMYAAKAAGRGTYRFFQAAMTETAEQRLQLETELRRAVRGGELELHYQPKVALHGGAARAVEALVRWRHPRHGLIPPASFIGLAEETGIIGELGDWVLEEACRQARAWREQGLGRIHIAVNVSAMQLRRGGLVERIGALTSRYGVAPEDLELELTESVIMDNPTEIAAVFARLGELGVSIAIDDFGTGYSSLAYLRQLPIDVLKIDRAFIMNAEHNRKDAELVKTIIALGRALQLDVVAEGVETAGQLTLLRALGCDLAQGFLFSRPLPPAEIGAWLGAQRGAPLGVA
ncbi:EAL domain-containing protein [Janthinobacterium sp.]|uniref:bifunctional diguanylate cyclase/phosphodiesterase n=1 Tax=Janthinobacterium sp. TaxID=1871054 RepID=UPI00293D4699|nr:EAL domain-containing protein [Janthinobacterium sp.]